MQIYTEVLYLIPPSTRTNDFRDRAVCMWTGVCVYVSGTSFQRAEGWRSNFRSNLSTKWTVTPALSHTTDVLLCVVLYASLLVYEYNAVCGGTSKLTYNTTHNSTSVAWDRAGVTVHFVAQYHNCHCSLSHLTCWSCSVNLLLFEN